MGVEKGTFERWTAFPGELDVLESASIQSSLSQPATLLHLAPEGGTVEPGDLVAIFDVGALSASLATLERDLTLAESELRTLEAAELPLRRDRLQAELAEARSGWEQEERIRGRMAELAEESLISPGELATWADRVERLRESVSRLEAQQRIQEEILFPALLEQARARATSARRQWELVREQVDGATISAPIGGRVVLPPLHLQGEFRAARAGD